MIFHQFCELGGKTKPNQTRTLESFKVSKEINVHCFVFLYLLPNMVIEILIKIQLLFFLNLA